MANLSHGDGTMASPVQATSLEQLPPEIRRQVLFNFDLDDLKAIVFASPVFYQQYCLDRQAILRNSLDLSIGSAAISACALLRFEALRQFPSRSAPGATEAVDAFLRAHNANEARLYSAVQLTHAEVVSIAAHFSKVVEPVGDAFAFWALGNLELGKCRSEYEHLTLATEPAHGQSLGDADNLPHEEHPDDPAIHSPQGEQSEDPSAISTGGEENSNYSDSEDDTTEDSSSDSSSEAEIAWPTRVERIRIFRALYRVDLCCRMFGAKNEAEEANSWVDGWMVEQGFTNTCKVFDGLETWELEEVRSVNLFVTLTYNEAFEKMTTALDPTNPRYVDGYEPPVSPDTFEKLDDMVNLGSLELGTSTLGVTHFWDLLRKGDAEASDEFVQMLSGTMRHGAAMEMEEDVFSIQAQYTVRDESLKRSQKATAREKMPFSGEDGRKDDEALAPYAWGVLCKGRYRDLFGDCLPFWWAERALVIWEASRLVGSMTDNDLRTAADGFESVTIQDRWDWYNS
ncbi:uncharacterized protein C8A04DRAFT_29168 [Dichotomopilus funicola]|uniref:Uncharacterized protein n=1 Tax=Dichotomopilus funicola TaxID=1934379 RepID=A0AAN6ZN29_9PEZI|nr:hypothetical protein C8A04DRAFT_29168 [Dichotomopilus funicola]